MSRRSIFVTATCGAIAAVIATLALTRESTYQLEKEGNAYIALIENYRAQHGKYPAKLGDANVNPTKTRFGGWKYRPSEDDRKFCLSIGDYGEDLFVLFWDSDYNAWYLDD